MIKCPNCGSELRDDAKFCGECGAKIEAPAPVTEEAKPEALEEVATEEKPAKETKKTAKKASKKAEKPAEEKPAGKAEAKPADEEPAKVEEPVEAPKAEVKTEAAAVPQVQASPSAPKPAKEKKPKNGLIIGIIAVVVIAIIAALVLLLGGKDGPKNNYGLYIKDKEIYYTNLKGDPWQLTSRLFEGDIDNADLREASWALSMFTYMSDDGKLIFFPDKINEDDDGFALYYRNAKKAKAEPVKIDSNVVAYTINEDASIVTYVKGDDTDLYQYFVGKDEKEKIATEIDDYYVSKDGKKVIYIDDEGNVYLKEGKKDKEKLASDIFEIVNIDESYKTIYYLKDDALYKTSVGKDKEKIASDVSEVVKVYESGELYYLKAGDEETAFAKDYVIDDMKEADSSMVEPEYPYSFDYDTEEEYDAAYEAYEKAYDAYYEKEERDDIREILDTTEVNIAGNALCYFDGKKETVVANNVSEYSLTPADEKPVILYTERIKGEGGKIKLSEIKSAYSVEEEISELLDGGTKTCVAVEAKGMELKQEDAGDFNLAEDGSKLFFIANEKEDKDYGDLMCVTIKSGSLGKPEVYDTEVNSSYLRIIGDDIYYLKNVKSDSGDLYWNKELVSYDISVDGIEYDENSKTLVFFTDWDEDRDLGTLNVYKGKGDPEKVADDVATCSITPDGRVLYLYDYSYKHYSGELHVWKNGKTEKIDDDVTALLYLIPLRYRQIDF